MLKLNKLASLIIIFFSIVVTHLNGQVEICDNGIDDDFDNLTDLNDDDCACIIIEPVSLIPNPSFEEMDCCPGGRSQLNCATDWIQASEPTTDFIHLCDWLGWNDFPPPMPFPDGEGIMGFRDGRVIMGNAEPNWKEYAGACLLSPMFKDSVYRFEFDVGFVTPEKSPPIDISFFGTSDCINLPFGVGNESFGCPTNSGNWFKLGEVPVSGGSGNRWVKSAIEIVPEQDVYAIAIGPACNPVSSPISIYYFFDNLLLADIESFNLQISEINHPCSNDFSLSVPDNSSFDYQWYKSGVALIGETSSELSENYGEGKYQVRILDGASCRVSAEFEHQIPEFEETQRISICQGDVYSFGGRRLTESGFYLDTFKNVDNCDLIVSLELDVIGSTYDTIEANILQGETYEIDNFSFYDVGEYNLTLTSALGCDRLVLLKLTLFDLFIPNVFSPNEDGINDIFVPLSKQNNIESVEMRIFDRWGNLIHRGEDWDGEDATSGVYTYVIEIDFVVEKDKVFYGTVTVVK